MDDMPVSEPGDYTFPSEWSHPTYEWRGDAGEFKAPYGEHPRIVLGVDFSAASGGVVDAAIATAKAWHGDLVFVHAVRPMGAPGLDLGHPAFDAQRNESMDAQFSLPAGQARLYVEAARQAGVRTEVVARAGSPAEVLVQEARRCHAAAIVVGSRKAGLTRELLGSVARGVVEKSPVTVIVVPGSQAK